jgi:acetyltransferase-like isoleucine patch superfamily enzyme
MPILDCGIVTIGDRTLLGPNVSIFAATHETEVQSRRDGVEYAREVTIGNDCWIGGNTVSRILGAQFLTLDVLRVLTL